MNFKKILGDTVFSSARLLVRFLRGIILIPIITRLIGESAYGKWVVFLAVVNIVASIGGLHLHGALIRYTPQEDIPGQTLVDTLTLGILAAIVISTLMYVASTTFALLPELEQGESAALATSILLGVRIITLILKNYPRARSQVKKYESIELVQLLIEGIILAVVFWWTRSIVLGLWTLVAISALLSLLLSVNYVPRELRTPAIGNYRKYLEYSTPMVPKAMGSRILTNADKYLLNILVSPTAVAVYSVSYSVATILRNITTPLNSTLYPSVSTAWENKEFSDLERLYGNVLRGYTIVGIPAVVGISILAKPLLLLISTPSIADKGVYILPVLALGFYLRGYDNPLAYIFNAAEQNADLAKITIVTAAANLLMNLLLIPLLGIVGAVIATVISQSLVVWFIYIKAKKKIPLSLSTITLIRASVASFVMALVLILRPISFSSVQQVVLFPIIGLITYAFTIVGLGEISVNEVREAYTALRRNIRG